MTALLDVQDLHTQFKTDYGVVNAVNGVSFQIHKNEIVGFVGESGCGKSTTVLSVMQLIKKSPGKRISGKVIFEGRDLLELEHSSPEMCSVRGGKISMIFQEPMTSLNPTATIGAQLTEMLKMHLGMGTSDARKKTVNFPPANQYYDKKKDETTQTKEQ